MTAILLISSIPPPPRGPVPARIIRRTRSGACKAIICATPPPKEKPRRSTCLSPKARMKAMASRPIASMVAVPIRPRHRRRDCRTRSPDAVRRCRRSPAGPSHRARPSGGAGRSPARRNRGRVPDRRKARRQRQSCGSARFSNFTLLINLKIARAGWFIMKSPVVKVLLSI
jgi:hypothetical protein